MSPTYTVDVARALETIVRQLDGGTFHIVNQGQCSWHEFASAALALGGVSATAEHVSTRDYQTRARRPANSALTSLRLSDVARVLLRPWQEALNVYLREMNYATAVDRPG